MGTIPDSQPTRNFTRMPFGKFKGTPLDQLDDPYVLWLATLEDLRDPLKSALEREIDRRNAAARSPEAAQAPTIRVSTFQPFESREGIDEVLRLDFHYDPAVIGHLKAALAEHHTCEQVAGGWLAREKCWFCELGIWPMVRARLKGAGVVIVEEAG